MRNFAESDILVTKTKELLTPSRVFFDDRDNIAGRMSASASLEVRTVIENRYHTANERTDKIADDMTKFDKQYRGEWQDGVDEDGKIFLTKTKEQVKAVYSQFIQILAELNPIVTFTPMVSSIWASNEEYRRAKVAEALMQFFMEDTWKIKEDKLPIWLKHFIKYHSAWWKITYRDDDFQPDLNLDVIDRALLYLDPIAKVFDDSRWVIEKYWLPKSEVLERIEQGHWVMEVSKLESAISSGIAPDLQRTMSRIFGNNVGADQFSVEEDELVEIWDYWQAPIKGLNDVYAVIVGGVGGELVRYGKNPFPYKGLPYVTASYDMNENSPDGTGLVEEYRPIQEVVNNFLNMRIDDVRKNIIRPVVMNSKLIDSGTQEAWKEGHKIIPLAEEASEAMLDPTFDIRRHIAELPISTSTSELLVQDLPFMLNQGTQTTGISDVFRGMNPQSGATLGQVQEQLAKGLGAIRPSYMQIMRALEKVAAISFEYFKSPEFFPTERIIQVVGKNKYQDIIEGWHNPGGNLFIREVSPDEMDVDVTLNAVNGADAIASRTFLMLSLEQIFQSIGQIPELFSLLKEELDFAKIVEMMINTSGNDIDEIKLTPQEKQAKAQQNQQAQQQAQQMQQQIALMQVQLDNMKEEGKQVARAKSQMAIDSNKVNLDTVAKESEIKLSHEAKLDQDSENTKAQLIADITLMIQEAKLERSSPGTQVGHDNNVRLQEAQGQQ